MISIRASLARPVQLQGFKRWKGTSMCERLWKAYDIITSAHNKM